MEIRLPSALVPTPSAPKGIANLLAQLQPGQTLAARVEAQLSPSSYLLSLGENGPSLRARSKLDLTPGQLLKLEVVKLGDTPQLRLLPQTAPDDPVLRTIRQAVRAALPQQLGLNELAGALTEMLKHPGLALPTTPRPQPERLLLAIRTVLDGLPTKSDLTTPAGLKKAVENSGLFFESRQAMAGPEARQAIPETDLKGRLLNLIKQLEPYVGAAKQALEAAPAGTATPQPQPSNPEPAKSLPPTTVAPSFDQAEIVDTPTTSGAAPTKSNTSNAAPAPASEAAKSDQLTPSSGQSGGTMLDSIKRTLGIVTPGTPPPAEQTSPSVPTDTHMPASEEPVSSRGQTAPPGELPAKAALDNGPGNAMHLDRPHAPAAESAVRNLQEMVMDSAIPELKNLLQKSEGALARIVLDQLASQPQADGKCTLWQVEIPYREDQHADAARLKIVRERSHKDGREQVYWSVVLELQPPGLGTIHSRITLAGGHIDSYFWSDSPATAQLIDSNLELLAARLQQAGLEIGQLNTLPGAPTETDEYAPLPLAGLLSERA